MSRQIGIHAFNGPHQRQHDVGLLTLALFAAAAELGNILKNGHHAGPGFTPLSIPAIRGKKTDPEQTFSDISLAHAQLNGIGSAGLKYPAQDVYKRQAKSIAGFPGEEDS